MRHVVWYEPAVLPGRRFVEADRVAALQRALSRIALGVIRRAGYRVHRCESAIRETLLHEACHVVV